jgi:UDP-N-acetylglucosamine 2-epimerase (non-hydrolysing)
MVAFEKICMENSFDLVVVGGDVNSTAACTIVAAKLGIPVAHVEAGLRSFDRTMPEEINRIITDHLSELLFTTEESANRNLQREGIAKEHIYFVGNCMIDSLTKYIEAARRKSPWQMFGVEPKGYGLLTLHRPSNVDKREDLTLIIHMVNEVSQRIPIVFPIHPRTRNRITTFGLNLSPSVILCDPLPYLQFLGLLAHAQFVLTDSGGIQEETTALHVPCLTLRHNTERPITLHCGTNRLVGTDVREIHKSVDDIFAGKWPVGNQPPLWDGNTALRIADIIETWASSHRA